jgi:hypothetical protein
MTEEEKKARIAELKKVPKPVPNAVLVALALGFVTLVRMPAAACAAHLSIGRGFLYGLLMFSWFFVCGASLYTRSRWGYAGLVVFSLLPALGLLGLCVHLLRLGLEGTLLANWPEIIHGSIAVVQLVMTVFMFRYLLARQVIGFVWRSA